MPDNYDIYSEILGKPISFTADADEAEGGLHILMDEFADTLLGWTHGGWDNENGGAGW